MLRSLSRSYGSTRQSPRWTSGVSCIISWELPVSTMKPYGLHLCQAIYPYPQTEPLQPMRLHNHIKKLGVCCVYEAIRLTCSWDINLLAHELNCSKRYIKSLRRQLREQSLHCSGFLTCQFAQPGLPGTPPEFHDISAPLSDSGPARLPVDSSHDVSPQCSDTESEN